MSYTQHMQDCCEMLRNTREYPTDTYLVDLVEICHRMDKYQSPDGIKPSLDFPIRAYVRCFQDDIHQLRKELNKDFASNSMCQRTSLCSRLLRIKLTQARSSRTASSQRRNLPV